MEKKTARLIKYVLLIFSFIALIVFSIIYYAVFFSSRARIQNQNEYNPSDTCLYHVIVTGNSLPSSPGGITLPGTDNSPITPPTAAPTAKTSPLTPERGISRDGMPSREIPRLIIRRP